MVTYVIRSKGTATYAYAMLTFAAIAEIASIYNGGWREGLWALPIVAAIALVGLILWWIPRLEMNDDGLTVVNFLRSVTIPWKDLKYTERRWGLYIYTYSLPKKIPVCAIASRAGLSEKALRAMKNSPSEIDPHLEWDGEPGKRRVRVELRSAEFAILKRRKEIVDTAGRKPTKATQKNQDTALIHSHIHIHTPSLIAIAALSVCILYAVIR